MRTAELHCDPVLASALAEKGLSMTALSPVVQRNLVSGMVSARIEAADLPEALEASHLGTVAENLARWADYNRPDQRALCA